MVTKESVFKEEEAHLKNIIDIINNKIEVAQRNFDQQKHTIIGFSAGMRGPQFDRQALMSLFATEVYNLSNLVKNPYFGRMDFIKDGKSEPEKIYIGRKALVDENGEFLSYDWRSPIASMYYDYSLGNAEYEYNDRVVKGDLLKKRQIVIENSELVSAQEQDTLTDDNILIKYLDGNADSRLKSIVATIQREQNKIIRNPLKNNYIVQGVAGSGKTTVALHRIAYLLYNEAKNINESDFMILGPNKYFLNYISELLPDLDIKSVSQSTFEEIALDIINAKVKLETQNETLQNVLLNKIDYEIINYKSSLEYLKLLEDFVKKYIYGHLKEPIIYDGIELCSLESINDSIGYGLSNSYGEKISSFKKLLVKRIKSKYEDLSQKVWEKYKEEFTSLPLDHPRRQEIIAHINEVKKNIKNGCQKQIKEYFKFSDVSCINLYTAFLDYLDQEIINNDSIDCNKLKKYTLDRLRKKKIGNDDLAPLMYINYLIKGINAYNDYTHLVIDEGQDLSLSQYYILKLLFPKCTFDIFGDLNQSIYAYQGINDWNELNELVFNSNSNILGLNKGYRTTAQISEGSNYILDEIGKQKSECVARDGEEIDVVQSENLELDILNQIEDFLNKKYKTIAIICKDSEETDLVHKKLTKMGLNIHKISEDDLTYNGGLCVMPSYLSKGLEFDAVILYNANDKNYDYNSIIDMKLLYVGITRALHKLKINCNGELAKPLKTLLKEKSIQKKLK